MMLARHANDKSPFSWWVFVVAGVLFVLLRTWFLGVFIIPSESMEPTFEVGSRAWVNKMDSPSRGDVVVFSDPGGWSGVFTNSKDKVIKRVIGLGGDVVACHEGKLSVNGQQQDEPYVKAESCTVGFSVRVPEGSLWVMGDNRESSGDSRIHGAIDSSLVVGVVINA